MQDRDRVKISGGRRRWWRRVRREHLVRMFALASMICLVGVFVFFNAHNDWAERFIIGFTVFLILAVVIKKPDRKSFDWWGLLDLFT